jgi:hypothetical protein
MGLDCGARKGLVGRAIIQGRSSRSWKREREHPHRIAQAFLINYIETDEYGILKGRILFLKKDGGFGEYKHKWMLWFIRSSRQSETLARD